MSFVKWAGGKNAVKDRILQSFPKDFNIYIEPFVGGGTILFNLKPQRAIISDTNACLISCYHAIKTDVNSLIEQLTIYQNEYAALQTPEEKREYFDVKKKMYNDNKLIEPLPSIIAPLFIFLNKTSFNGIYRENRKGLYNVPVGRQSTVSILDTKRLLECSKTLQNVEIFCQSYELTIRMAKRYENPLIYLDPPYYVCPDSKFVGYSDNPFTNDDQLNLLKELEGLSFYQSNSYCDPILELYSEYNIEIFELTRSISSADRSIKKKEVLIYPKKTETTLDVMDVVHTLMEQLVEKVCELVDSEKKKTVSLVNRGTGAGGSNTTKNGSAFEHHTDITNYLVTEQSFVKDTLKRYNFYSKKCPNKTIYFVSQTGFKKLVEKLFGIPESNIYRKPDEAFIIIYDEPGTQHTIKILEKKNQNCSGSVDDKLHNGSRFRRIYGKMMGTDFHIEYAYCVSKFLQIQYCSDKPKSVHHRQLDIDDNINVFFGESSNYFNELYEWVNSN